MDSKQWISLICMLGLFLPFVSADNNTYIADLSFATSQSVYAIGELVGLKGSLSLANYSGNGSLVSNYTVAGNASINVSFISISNGTIASFTNLNTTALGEFYSQSDFYSTATALTAPTAAGFYHIRVNYTDPNSTSWWTQAAIEVVNKSVDRYGVRPSKSEYSVGEAMTITVEAIQKTGDQITFVSNISINGSIRDSEKTVLSNFSCVTGSSGKCTIAATAPTSYGTFLIEVNSFKAFSSFDVTLFEATAIMKDELGKSIKHVFDTGEQSSVEVNVLTNSTSESYTFDGIILNNVQATVKQINSTTLNSTNSYTNRVTFVLDSLNFSAGSYRVELNVTKSSGELFKTTTSFEVRSWIISILKREVGSGFEYEYSTFPNRTLLIDIFPTWRANGSVLTDVNITTGINISLHDALSNELNTMNATWNQTCGAEGCYQFSFLTPSIVGEYYLQTLISYGGVVQTARKTIRILNLTLSALSSDSEGNLKELFNSNDYAYLTLSTKNTSNVVFNATDADLLSVIYMNGTEISYTEVSTFTDVNTSNSQLEWAWNKTYQRIKLDTPAAGGVYTVHLSAENASAATSARFIVNPYEVCIVPKDTAGDAGGSTGNYYVYQFKTSDPVYFELQLTQATNPLGRASSQNLTGGNSSYGMGNACTVNTQTAQVVNNATITVEEVVNMDSGKIFVLNQSQTSCLSDDNQGGYTCTVTAQGNWDGGKYGVKFKIVGQDGQTSDITYGGFEARAFYLYAYSTNWRNRPTDNITLTVDMYEAGSNWWGNYGSGGLSGTVTIEKIEYLGLEGEWLNPPIVYSTFNVSTVNSSSITNGRGTITLPTSSLTATSQWRTGMYRAILKGVDADGNADYGYAWFEIRRWEAYSTPIDCSGGQCTYSYNINSKKNVTLYITINNAGQWGVSGNDLGGSVTISVKKIQDCRSWPCKDLNASLYNATSTVVSRSSGWFWNGNVNHSYMINITPTSGSWGSGYYQTVLDINGTENGRGWFNTIAFYIESQPTDINGTNWQYNIKNNHPKYFKISTVRSQRGWSYYTGYNTTDYLNTTISSATLRRWDEVTGQSVALVYPTDLNVTINGGGTVLNGSRIINITRLAGNWSSGYYSGELVLEDAENQTATGWLWFKVEPFRVALSSPQFTIDNDVCINGTINMYEPDWRINTLLNQSFTIASIFEQNWNGGVNTRTLYTNFTPSGSFMGNSSFTICPNNGKWGSGSWGNYHYLTVIAQDASGNQQSGWLSFRALPFSASWGSIVGGTSVLKTSNIQVPVTVTKATSGKNTTGNLSRLSQWRWDGSSSTYETYNFSVGSCDTRTAGVSSCQINATQTVTIYAPGVGWREGYNYLETEWREPTDTTSIIRSYASVWFNGVDVYRGYFNAVNRNGNWKNSFVENENITIKLTAQSQSGASATVNVTAVEYSMPGSTCWSEYCRSYTSATYSIVGQSNNQITGNGILEIAYPSSNWTKGYVYIRATVSGANGSTTIKNGQVQVKDFTVPTITLVSPTINSSVNTTPLWINWTTPEAANCLFYIANFKNFQSWTCNGWNTTNSSNSTTPDTEWIDSCNVTKYNFSGATYYYENIQTDYKGFMNATSSTWKQGATSLSTGGLNHSFALNITQYPAQHYGIRVSCSDSDWNWDQAHVTLFINGTGLGTSSSSSSNTSTSSLLNTTLITPLNGSIASAVSGSNTTFNYSFAGYSTANCSLYGNFTGNWTLNITSTNRTNGTFIFSQSIVNGTYLWNVACMAYSNSSNVDWGDSNWTFRVNLSG